MAKRGFTVGRFKEMFDAGKNAQEQAEEPVRLAIELMADADPALVQALKEAFVPLTSHAMLHVARVVPGEPLVVNPEADVALIVCGSSFGYAAARARAWMERGVTCCLVALDGTELGEVGLVTGASASVVTGKTPAQVVKNLGAWFAGASKKSLAMARNFAFCRHAVAARSISQCAAANAGVGAVELIKGADFPVMVATDSSLMCNIAVAYGYDLGPKRALEVAAICGAGMGLRALARAGVKAFPKVAWAMRGSIAWVGTYALGYALLARFQAGERFDQVLERAGHEAKSVAKAIGERARSVTGKSIVVEPGAVYVAPPTKPAPAPHEVVDVVVAPSSWFEVSGGHATQANS